MDKGERIRRMIDKGMTAVEIGKKLGCPRVTVVSHALPPEARSRVHATEYAKARQRGLSRRQANARANSLLQRACSAAYWARYAEARATASAPPALRRAPPPAAAE